MCPVLPRSSSSPRFAFTLYGLSRPTGPISSLFRPHIHRVPSQLHVCFILYCTINFCVILCLLFSAWSAVQ